MCTFPISRFPGNFTQDFNSFLEAASASAQREFDAQLFFSYIIQNGTWDQPQVWFIPGTDEVYEDEQDIPPDLKMLVSVRSRFSSQEEFIQWCGDNVLGFTRSTFWRRHSSIDKYTKCLVMLDDIDKVLSLSDDTTNLPELAESSTITNSAHWT